MSKEQTAKKYGTFFQALRYFLPSRWEALPDRDKTGIAQICPAICRNTKYLSLEEAL